MFIAAWTLRFSEDSSTPSLRHRFRQPKLHSTDLDAEALRIQICLMFPVFWETENAQIRSFGTRKSTLYSRSCFSSFLVRALRLPEWLLSATTKLSDFPEWLPSNLQLVSIAVTRSQGCCRHNCKMWSRCCSVFLISIFIPPPRLLVLFCCCLLSL